MSALKRWHDWRVRRRSAGAARPGDVRPTIVALLLSVLGLAALAWLGWTTPSPDDWASRAWLPALAAVIAGVIIGAPVFTGRFLVVLVVAGFTVTGVGLVRLGTARISDERREEARETATLLAYRLEDIGARPDPSPAAALCVAAGGALVDVDPLDGGGLARPLTCEEAGASDVSLQDLSAARAGADLAVAEEELARADSDAAADAAKDAVARAREAISDPEVDSVELRTALAAGASAVVDDLLFDDDTLVPVAFATLGWVVVAAVAIALVRWAAVRNSTRGLGPVTLEAAGTADALWPNCQEVFRTHLLKNVPEPGAVPNADALNAVADLVGSLAPQARPGSAVFDAVSRLVVVPRGYSVQVGVMHTAEGAQAGNPVDETSSDPTAEGCGLVVRVRKTRTLALLDQKEFWFEPGAISDRVVREAAYWAAAVIIDASRSVPEWARWSRHTAGALAEYFEAERGDDKALEHLNKAERGAPSSGLILLQLAHGKETGHDLAGALEHSLDAAALYPRYLDAHYRLASEAGMLALELRRKPVEISARLCRSADRLLEASPGVVRRTGLGSALWDYVDAPDGHDAGRARDKLANSLLVFSIAERKRARHELRLVVLAANAFRSTERDVWLPMLLRRRMREDRRQRLASADVVVRAKLGRHDERRERAAVRRARRRGVLWQVPYNMACHYSLEGNLKGAVDMLERARVARESHQLTREWLDNDPDLEQLRTGESEWFERDFRPRCRSGRAGRSLPRNGDGPDEVAAQVDGRAAPADTRRAPWHAAGRSSSRS